MAQALSPLISGTFQNPNPCYFLKSTNWRCIASFPFLQSLEASKAQRYKWGSYCGTNWRCTASTFWTSCAGWGFLNSAHTEAAANRRPNAIASHRNLAQTTSTVFFAVALTVIPPLLKTVHAGGCKSWCPVVAAVAKSRRCGDCARRCELRAIVRQIPKNYTIASLQPAR